MDLKPTLITAAFVAVFSFALGYKLAINKHDKLIADIYRQNADNLAKEVIKANEYRQTAEKHYKAFLDADNREPVTVTERVYVKAKCPVLPTSPSGGMGNAERDGRAELHEETVRRITAVTKQAETDVLKCRAKLHSLQDKIKLFNKGK